MAQEKKAQPFSLVLTMTAGDDDLEGAPQEIIVNQRFTKKDEQILVQTALSAAINETLSGFGLASIGGDEPKQKPR